MLSFSRKGNTVAITSSNTDGSVTLVTKASGDLAISYGNALKELGEKANAFVTVDHQIADLERHIERKQKELQQLKAGSVVGVKVVPPKVDTLGVS